MSYTNDLPDDSAVLSPARRRPDPINDLLFDHQPGDRGVLWEDEHQGLSVEVISLGHHLSAVFDCAHNHELHRRPLDATQLAMVEWNE